MAWDSDYQYEPSHLFSRTFYCLPFCKYKRPHLETGDKIIMPPSSLNEITFLPISYPFFFKIESFNSDKISHCGVLEFDAEEGFVYMPEWMMKNLNVQEGDGVVLSNANLSRGCYMKLQPHATSFIELTNPKAVLEMTLRGFSCLTRGDTIMVKHDNKEFYLDVVEVSPGNAINLIETDCFLDFATPLDYKEPQVKQEIKKVDGKAFKPLGMPRQPDGVAKEEGKAFRPFMGMARRLDGLEVTVESGGCSGVDRGRSKVEVEERKKSKKDSGKEEEGQFKPFTGRSRVLG